MPSVDDVAAAVLERTGTIDTFKLQKLVYYCQAWHLAWEGELLYDARIEAWANGPVIPELYRKHRGEYRIEKWTEGNPDSLGKRETSTIDSVVDFYNKYSGWELAELTHRETPWREARAGLGPNERGNQEIKPPAMLEFYSGLTPTS